MTTTSKTYFGGLGVESPDLRELPAKSWGDLVGESINDPHLVGITRSQFDEFLKSNPSYAKTIKNSRPYVMPGIFEGNRRKKENLVGIALIGMDFDTGPLTDPKEIEILRQFVRDGTLLAQRLPSLNFVAYTTIRHTTEFPRVRLLIDCEDITVEQYPAAVRTISAILGLKHDPQSEGAWLPMSAPCLFSDEDPVLVHPVFSSRTNGTPFAPKNLLATEIEQPQEGGEEDLTGLLYQRSPIMGVGPKEAAEALNLLDPDTVANEKRSNYQTWIEMGMALKHQLSDAGFAIWDEWSRKGAKYPGTLRLQGIWATFVANPSNSAPVTFASVINLAKAKGWNFSAISTKSEQDFRTWVRDQTRTEEELRIEAVKRAAAMPHIDSTDCEMMGRWIATELNDRFKCDMTAKEVAKKIKKAANFKDGHRQLTKTVKSVDESLVPKWARGWVLVSGTEGTVKSTYYRHATADRWSRDSLNDRFSRYLLPEGKVESLEQTPAPVMRPDVYLRDAVRIPAVNEFLYCPAKGAQPIVDQEGKRYANTYRATYAEPEPGLEVEARALWDKQMEITSANPAERATLTDWFAYLVQYPGEKIMWAPVLLGPEGTGKSLLCQIMEKVLGHSNVKMTKGDTVLNSNFSSYTEGAQLVCIEEIKVAGSNRLLLMNKFKDQIANYRVETHSKGVNPYNVINITNYIFCTNEPDALALTEGSRRYYIVDSALHSKAEVVELKGHYDNIWKFVAAHPGAFRSMLLNHKISASFESKAPAPETGAFLEMVNVSKSDVQILIEDLLEAKSNPLVTPRIMVVDEVVNEAKVRGVPCFGGKDVTRQLRALGYLNTKSGKEDRHAISGKRYLVWTRDRQSPPSVEEVRAAVAACKQS